MRGWLAATILVVACVGATSGQGGQKAPVSEIGPAVGQTVPDLALVDQTGKQHTLQSLMGPKGAMLVFFRSADW